MNFDKLKKVPPLDNKAPVIRPDDVRWSLVFQRAAERLKSGEDSFLCHAIQFQLGIKRHQAKRMQGYVYGLMPDPDNPGNSFYTFLDWADAHGIGFDFDDRGEIRAAWARHLAAQFRAKGL